MIMESHSFLLKMLLPLLKTEDVPVSLLDLPRLISSSILGFNQLFLHGICAAYVVLQVSCT